MSQNDNHGHGGHGDVSISGFNNDSFTNSPVSLDFDHGGHGNVDISGFNGDSFTNSPVDLHFS